MTIQLIVLYFYVHYVFITCQAHIFFKCSMYMWVYDLYLLSSHYNMPWIVVYITFVSMNIIVNKKCSCKPINSTIYVAVHVWFSVHG
jgi:hypothetical protein